MHLIWLYHCSFFILQKYRLQSLYGTTKTKKKEKKDVTQDHFTVFNNRLHVNVINTGYYTLDELAFSRSRIIMTLLVSFG